jgi:hypothetical protein
MTALTLIAVWAFGPPIEDSDRDAVAKGQVRRTTVLFPAVNRRWEELLFECRKLVILTYTWLEQEGLAEGENGRGHPGRGDDRGLDSQAPRACSLDCAEKLGETDRSLEVAVSWVRSELERRHVRNGAEPPEL